MKKWKIVLILAAMFISGTIVGSVGTRLYVKQKLGGIMHRNPQEVTAMAMKKLTSELSLTQEQRPGVEKIVEDTQAKLRQLRDQYHPQMEKILADGFENAKPLLTPEQQKKLDSLHNRMETCWRSKGRQCMRGN